MSELVSLKEASEMLKVHENTIRNWIKKGLMTFSNTPGGHYRFDKTNLININNQREHMWNDAVSQMQSVLYWYQNLLELEKININNEFITTVKFSFLNSFVITCHKCYECVLELKQSFVLGSKTKKYFEEFEELFNKTNDKNLKCRDLEGCGIKVFYEFFHQPKRNLKKITEEEVKSYVNSEIINSTMEYLRKFYDSFDMEFYPGKWDISHVHQKLNGIEEKFNILKTWENNSDKYEKLMNSNCEISFKI